MRMGLAVSMVAGTCLIAAWPGTAAAAPADIPLDEVTLTVDPIMVIELVKVLDLGDLGLIPDDSTTPDPGDATETIPGDDGTPTIPGDDETPTIPGDDETPTIPGDDETPTIPGNDDTPTIPGDDTRTRLPFTGGNPLPFIAIGLPSSLAGTGLFLRSRGRAAEASFRDNMGTSS